ADTRPAPPRNRGTALAISGEAFPPPPARPRQEHRYPDGHGGSLPVIAAEIIFYRLVQGEHKPFNRK
ncbi:hypothetical protein, partial [Microbispora hainanensis]|uniref:hypothetical protein n=1 Tax=Microbispora hainanensis TaxID=568844 RepID=UPI0033DD7F8C